MARSKWIRCDRGSHYDFYKSCPKCTYLIGQISYWFIYRMDKNTGEVDASGTFFGITPKRATKNDPYGSQSQCKPCRGLNPPTLGQSIETISDGDPHAAGRWVNLEFKLL